MIDVLSVIGPILNARRANQELYYQNAIDRAKLGETGREFDVTSGEQKRQFDAENALRQQLGLGDLSYKNAALGEQGRQFNAENAFNQSKLGETGREFDVTSGLNKGQMDLAAKQEAINNAYRQKLYDDQKRRQDLIDWMTNYGTGFGGGVRSAHVPGTPFGGPGNIIPQEGFAGSNNLITQIYPSFQGITSLTPRSRSLEITNPR